MYIHVIHWPLPGSRRSYWWVVEYRPGKGYTPIQCFGQGPDGKERSHQLAEELCTST